MNTELIYKMRSLVDAAASQSGAEFEFEDIDKTEILVDDESTFSALINFRPVPFVTDDGRVDPQWVSLQIDFNRDDDQFYLIIGEDTEEAITYGNVMASMYFTEIERACWNDIDGKCKHCGRSDEAKESSASPTGYAFRFRGLRGVIYSNNPDAFEPRVTQGRVKDLLNELYSELAKHDPAMAEEICKRRNV